MPADARASAAADARAPREMRHFIARAREIARIAPTVAYYCRMRAVLDVLEVRAGDEG